MISSGISVQDELHAYLEEKDVKNLFVTVVEAILLEKPASPVKFIAEFLKDKFPSEVDDIFTVSKNRTLSEQVKIEAEAAAEISDQSDDSSDSDSDDEAASECLPPMTMGSQKRRSSICAEKLHPTKANEQIKKIPKSEEELAQIRIILEKCVLFEHLDEVQMKTVQDAMFPVEKDDQEVIIKQGDDGDNFYVIESGFIDVYIESKEGSKLVNSYSNGESFGELAIMYNAPRAATCVATNGQVKLWALDRNSFKLILMKTAINKRNQYSSFLQKIPILSQLTEHEILTIADALHEETFDTNSVICKQGENGDRFYIIKEGTVVCTKSLNNDGHEEEVAYLTNGAYFGEIALLTTKKRQATVTSCGTLECVSLDRKTFKRVMGSLENILMRNIDAYNQYQASRI